MDLAAAIETANRLLSDTADQANAALAAGDPKAAKRIVTNGQRELRDLKRQVTAAEQEMRAEFQAARLKANKSGQVVGAFTNSKTRSAMSRGRAMQKRKIADRQADATNDYRYVKTTIDNYVAQLSSAKATIDEEIAAQRSGPSTPDVAPLPPPPAAQPPPPTPPMWAPDPFRRHELRYWDGVRWTEHVSTNGTQSVDPAE